jgi:hypothetical protein
MHKEKGEVDPRTRHIGRFIMGGIVQYFSVFRDNRLRISYRLSFFTYDHWLFSSPQKILSQNRDEPYS